MAHLFYSVKPGDYRQTVLCKLIDLSKILDKLKNKTLKEGKHTYSHTPKITVLNREPGDLEFYEGKNILLRDNYIKYFHSLIYISHNFLFTFLGVLFNFMDFCIFIYNSQGSVYY